ncbi:universal stress protein [Thermosulfuriphilus sp.]
MKDRVCTIEKVLLPIDGSLPSKRAAEFTACLTAPLGERVQKITLLHVLAGGYLSAHMANIDIRTEFLKETALFKRLKEQYLEKNVTPMFEEVKEVIRSLGVRIPVEQVVLDGDPAREIVRFAQENHYSTIVMGRRGLSPVRELLLGSVTQSVIHRPGCHTTYVVGQEVLVDGSCPIPRVLIPIDGSPNSLGAVNEIACLLEAAGPNWIEKITILYVIDISFGEDLNDGQRLEGEDILATARQILIEAGAQPERIKREVRLGRPAEEIIRLAEEENYNLVIMGRRGRSHLKELVLGSVSATVLHRLSTPTLALVCVED